MSADQGYERYHAARASHTSLCIAALALSCILPVIPPAAAWTA